MKNKKTIIILSLCLALLAAIAAAAGIFSRAGSGSYDYHSIRNQTVSIYGKGLYRHMSADVAIQGIAQDYVTLLEFNLAQLPARFSSKTPVKWIGGFLIFLSSAIGLLWLQVIVTPLIDGSIIPRAVEHYTSLTVQGFDLSIFLPIAFLSGVLLIKRKAFGYLLATVTLTFLVLLMTALVAKIIAMAHAGVNVIPVVFIIPIFDLLALVSAMVLFKHMKNA